MNNPKNHIHYVQQSLTQTLK